MAVRSTPPQASIHPSGANGLAMERTSSKLVRSCSLSRRRCFRCCATSCSSCERKAGGMLLVGQRRSVSGEAGASRRGGQQAYRNGGAPAHPLREKAPPWSVRNGFAVIPSERRWHDTLSRAPSRRG